MDDRTDNASHRSDEPLTSSLTLLERAQAGDRTALETLIARYRPRLARWASGRLTRWARDITDTQDLVQETLFQTLERIEAADACGRLVYSSSHNSRLEVTLSDSKAADPSIFSRRQLLEAASGIGVTVAGALFTGSAASAEQAASTTPSGGLNPASLPKRWSQQEMSRRWAAARAAMKAQKFDGLLVTDRPDGSADIGWLTGSGGQYGVLAQDGKLLVIGGGDGERYDGVESREAPDGRFSEGINAAIKELGLTQGRIGVGYLQDVARLPEGGFNYTTLERARRANPRARFDSAADLLLMVKLPRSAEEIGVLEKATAISELGLQAIQRTARPGAVHRDVWLAIYNAMVNGSGEFPTRLSVRSGQEGNTGPRPLEEAMQAGTICNQELSATVLGYGSQVNQSMLIGGPAPADWRDAAQYCIDLFDKMMGWIKPGKRISDGMDYYKAEVEKRGEGYWGVLFHSGGGNDGPRWGPGRAEAADAVLQEGMVFTIKPRIPIKGVKAPAAQFGDAVVVTANGARRLGTRKMEILSLG